ncbi:hypothetical protein [Terasakiella pusilla]|uniref:hypothetical protein n=1 Tax=Terasakiella pusilla TaxID=64973 RepID=UPI0004915287|nr:hypothetical protein [Terasakiella pusilla]
MRILGIRVEPKKTTFVILEIDGDSCSIMNCEQIKVPAALDFPEKLKYIRNCVLDILREYDAECAGIRIAESSSQNLDVTRLHIEGVIQEAFSSSTVKKYFTGRKGSIAARLGMDSKKLEKIFKGEETFSEIEKFEVLSNRNSREAALVAMGAFKS